MDLLRVLSSVSPPWAGHLGSGACSLALPKGVRGKDRMVPHVEDMLVPHSMVLLYRLSFKFPEELSLDVEISMKIQRTLSPLHRQADL